MNFLTVWEKIENGNRTNTTNTVIHRLLWEPDDSTSARVYYFTSLYFYKISMSSHMLTILLLRLLCSSRRDFSFFTMYSSVIQICLSFFSNYLLVLYNNYTVHICTINNRVHRTRLLSGSFYPKMFSLNQPKVIFDHGFNFVSWTNCCIVVYHTYIVSMSNQII